MTRPIPRGLLLGAATAAYQVEGAVTEGGRTASIWDTFSHTPGKVAGGATGDVACDHYHRWREDVDHMTRMGLECYRLSIAWPRVQPGGTGPLNPVGVRHYRELLTTLREAGIKPLVTLYHWDLPQELEDAGGWRNRDTAHAFADYARAMAAELGDLVHAWLTINEPLVITYTGHLDGIHAPGLKDGRAVYAVAHHLNLAHGLAARAIKEVLPGATVGLALNYLEMSTNDNDRDRAALAKARLLLNDVFIAPILDGGYSPELRALTAPVTDWSFVLPGDEDLVRAPVDLFGLNYYGPHKYVADLDPGTQDREGVLSQNYGHAPIAGPRNALDMPVEAAGLTRVLREIHARWGVPLAITENGACTNEPSTATGERLADPDRVRYLHEHIGAVLDAMDAGVDVRAYCVWSLMDNFEWALGYDPRFGLLHVDYATGVRTWKDSAYWYAQVIASRSLPDEAPAWTPAFARGDAPTRTVLSATN